jgi:dihydroxyacetone kinase-like protein
MDVALARAWITAIAAAITADADHLTRLDAAIGDGDHGVNLQRGFTAVLAALDNHEAATVGDVLVRTGGTLVSKVGGAAGPLYGTAFRAMGKALPTAEVDAAALGGALRAGLDGVRKLGAAAPGEKTMVDAYGPATDAYDAAIACGGDLATGAAAAARAAEAGMLATTAMQARKGRASYLGPRSIGHQDPGATSTTLIFRALASVTHPR